MTSVLIQNTYERSQNDMAIKRRNAEEATVTETPNTHSENKTKKPIWKKWWFWLIVILIIGCIGSDSDDTTQQPNSETVTNVGDDTNDNTANVSDDTTQKSETTIDNESESEQGVSLEECIETVKTAITGTVGQGEVIKDVTLKDKDLCVYVDLSSATPQIQIPLDALAMSRTSSITDKILELEQYEELWETITIDFGELGYIRNEKDDIRDDGYGKYFSGDFKLETNTP